MRAHHRMSRGGGCRQPAANPDAAKLKECDTRRKAAILRAARLVDGRDPDTGLSAARSPHVAI